ncbi:uncharacterized protein LOC124292120 [Haliotis rubra]|uniref:uncharacterized protein LOC124292120 n=1 Tax=Haliotis rubra TaxID=36100 RepID=UPI001EE5E31E|nr:uncharacterized protein LOC124292120 [Haliotis rubra]
MTERLRNVHGLRVPRHMVMEILRIVDPDRVSARRTQRFSRRLYSNKGPNYLVHIDGYDKITPFGFAIHGAICGFSRRILWLKVGRSNKDPYVVGHYFLHYVDSIGGVPRCIRMDRGTENVFIEDIQKAMRWSHTDDMAGENSVLYGSSHRNQRIERWWLSLRQNGADYWINLFKDMESQGIVSTDNNLHMECLRFCFTRLIQTELDQIANEWNQHRVRRTGADVSGKPDLLFFLPSEYGTVDFKTEVDARDIHAIQSMCTIPRPSGCEEEFEDVCQNLLILNGKTEPKDTQEALDLYAWLVSKLEGNVHQI